MLQPAKLRALAAINSRFACRKLYRVLLAIDEVHLPHKAWYPEAMNDVSSLELYGYGLSDWNADFIGGVEFQMWPVGLILNFPPPLMSDDLNRERVRSLAEDGALGAVADDRQSQHDQSCRDSSESDDSTCGSLKRCSDGKRLIAAPVAARDAEEKCYHHANPYDR